MYFKITARTILQLGAELISSDAIAFYELIKNAFDAESKYVDVRVAIRIPKIILDTYIDICSTPRLQKEIVFAEFREEVRASIDSESFKANNLLERIKTCLSFQELLPVLAKANYILIQDKGEGMSLTDLDTIYLTIGTRSRQKLKALDEKPEQPILGEKGLGRLSVMRLGHGLRVKTTKSGQENFNELEIDWNMFSHDSDALLETITFQPVLGKRKEDANVQGTSIYIFDLISDWTVQKLTQVANEELTRFIDPFGLKNRSFFRLFFNKKQVDLAAIDRENFKYSHAEAFAELTFDEKKEPVFKGRVWDKIYDQKKTFEFRGVDLVSILNTSLYKDRLIALGPFKAELYWFNRRLLRESQGVVDPENVKKFVATWGGGLSLYRDSFRVNPYGGPDDDWLDIDQKALSSGGYKLNRRQIIGKVDISSFDNPGLKDQTNREGIRDNQEKQDLKSLLKFFLDNEIRSYLNTVQKAEQSNLAALSLKEIESRVNDGRREVKGAVKYLTNKYPVLSQEKETLDLINDVLEKSTSLFKLAKASSDAFENKLKTTLDLAGLGLMVDVIAHELNRSTENAVKTINSFTGNMPEGLKISMQTLKFQLQTLQTRLKVIDPLGPMGRQTKSSTNLVWLITDTLKSHTGQFERHHISYNIINNSKSDEWVVDIVPGMIIQIIENLISNSVYWLKQQNIFEPGFKPTITLELKPQENIILFTDNGPGIPRDRKQEIFNPFYSTRSPNTGSGKGLGLYISKEIAKYHNSELSLLDNNNSKYLHTFFLKFK